MTHTHVLRGCRPEPLSGYLEGLGVLRLVGQQEDPSAMGRWTDMGFVLTTRLDDEALVRFFVEEYRPTPMVSPWNKGAGYRGDGKSKRAEQLVTAALGSTNPRLQPWRDALDVARQISALYPTDKEFSNAKNAIISRSRSLLPDEALDWVDAAIALTADGPVYPHILGTGANLGRLDLSANMLEHLNTVIGLRASADMGASRGWLRDALWATVDRALRRSAAGQYDPGRAGGLNSSTLDEGRALINPWSFILQLEGAVVFASGVARRLDIASESVAAMPFTVRPTASGSGHLSDAEPAKGELWLPLWSAPSTWAEMRRLFAEARLRWGSLDATSGLDAARAVATLGTDRGIPAFGRTVITERLGESPLAVPAGRVTTGSRAAVRLTGQLDPWLRRIRRFDSGPRSLRDGLRGVDTAIMALTDAATDASGSLQGILAAAAALDRTVGGNSTLARELDPAPPLDPGSWLRLLDDGTAEFALAWGLASLHEDTGDERRRDEDRYSWCASVRDYVRSTTRSGRRARLEWSSGPRLDIDVARDLIGSLAAVHVAHATRPRTSDESLSGEITVMRHGSWTGASVAEAFAAGRLDEHRIGQLVQALVLLDIDSAPSRLSRADRQPPPAVAPAWRILAPLFPAGRPPSVFVQTLNADRPDQIVLTGDSSWPSMLTRGAAEPVLRSALTRYRARLGAVRSFSTPDLARRIDGPRVAASLFVPVSTQTVQSLMLRGTVVPQKETKDS